MRFDPAVALEYARSIARPRRVGTPASDDVIAELAGRLKAFGCTVHLAHFEFSSPGERAVALFVLANQILIVVTFWTWGLNAWAPIAPSLLLASLILASGKIFRAASAASLRPPDPAHLSPLRRWWLARGRRYVTANVVAHLPQRAGAAAGPGLLLVAHSDSKSQSLPLLARVSLIAVAGLAALVFAVLNVARVAFPAATSAAAVAGLVGMVGGVPLMLVYLEGSGNASPGAIDNASGAGLVLHLAECLCGEPPALPVTVLITSAEELGLLGALAFVRAAGRPALQGMRVLNFDGVGTAGSLALVGRETGTLGRCVRETCRELQVPLGRLPAVGAQYDHLPFADLGLEALTLVTTGRAAISVHTARDNLSKLDVDGFRRAGEVAQRVLQRLA